MGLALCTRGTLGKSTGTLGSKSTGTLGKGTLCTYPPSRVPTAAVAFIVVLGLCWQQQRLPLPLLSVFVNAGSNCHRHCWRPLLLPAAVAITIIVGLCWRQQRLPSPSLLAFVASSSQSHQGGG